MSINELKPTDVNRKVIYTPLGGGKPEEGRITSWNDCFIFVDYTNVGRGQATSPEDLQWL